MDRRKFIGRTVLLSGTSLLLSEGGALATVPALPTHYVGIGRGGCNVIDYLKKTMPNVNITKALGVDYDFENGKIFLFGEPVSNALQPLVDSKSPLVIVYCLSGQFTIEGMLDFIKQLKQTERIFKLILQFPFNFEGKNRNKRAVAVADQISLISSFRSVHANHHRVGKETLGYNFELLNKLMVNLMLAEVE